jgi:glycosyltransferase involved in cell wall biosynthesis
MMRQDIKVSVIVPVYRVARFLPKCIESIQRQDYQNIEIILVDDGSDDESGEICDEYAGKDPRITVIHKPNGGVSSARNVGLDGAHGEYVCFVDGDDYVMADYVSYLLNLLEDNNADISVTTAMFGNFNEKQSNDMSIQVYDAVKATELMLCYRFPIGVYCRMFRRSFIERHGIRFRIELFIGEGFNFNMDSIQRANKIVVGHRKVYYYRRDNEDSAMSSFSSLKWENGLYAIRVIKENLIIKSDAIEKAWQYAWWRTNSDAYDSIVLAGAQDSNRKMYEDCKKIVRKSGFVAMKIPVSKKDKMRAILMTICPSLIPFLLKIRKKKYIG